MTSSNSATGGPAPDQLSLSRGGRRGADEGDGDNVDQPFPLRFRQLLVRLLVRLLLVYMLVAGADTRPLFSST
jgi:hypothetical protein